jgi:hypothetical protein
MKSPSLRSVWRRKPTDSAAVIAASVKSVGSRRWMSRRASSAAKSGWTSDHDQPSVSHARKSAALPRRYTIALIEPLPPRPRPEPMNSGRCRQPGWGTEKRSYIRRSLMKASL